MKNIKFSIVLMAVLLLPTLAHSIPRTIHVEWEYQYSVNVAGFRLYYDNNYLCETNDPSATSMNCAIDAPDGESWFTITALLQDDTESMHSSPFRYIFSQDLTAIPSANTLVGESPLPVTFDATASTGNIISYEWMFGDGESSSESIITHTYTSAGNYDVVLKVTDNTGAVDQQTLSVVVNSPTGFNNPPTAVISSSASVGDAPLKIEFDGSGSTDTEGAIVSYDWDMGDGWTATGSKVTHTYSSAGTFNATLTVTDSGGLTNTVSTPIIILTPTGFNLPPNAVISSSITSKNDPPIMSFDAKKSDDPDGHIIAFTWNFGDGMSDTGVSVEHTYSQDAIYTVTLVVTDNMGTNSYPAKFTVNVKDGVIQEPAKIEGVLPTIYYLLLD